MNGKQQIRQILTVDFVPAALLTFITLLDKAVQISKEMAKLLPDVNKERREHSELKKIRDQAYTHLKEAVDKILSKGKYLFRDNKSRLKGYKSDYIREVKLKQRLKRKKTGAKKDGKSS